MQKDKRERRFISAFKGYDKSALAKEDSFSDILNICSDAYPRAATRKKRGILPDTGALIYGIYSLDIHHDGESKKNVPVADCEGRMKAFYEKDGEYAWHDISNTTGTLTSADRRGIIWGTKLCFISDKICYDFLNSSESYHLEYLTEYPLGEVDGYFYELCFEECDVDGNESDSSSSFRRIRKPCYELSDGAKGDFFCNMPFNAQLREGDTIEIRGLSDADANGYYNIVSIPADRSCLVVESAKTFVQSSGCIYFERTLPEMDYVVAAANRLWGCRYGFDKSGRCVNEIYASALGDGRNWYRFLGVSTDSWTVSIGAPGAFTGAVCMDGHPVFFKEDCIIKVFGDTPDEFTVSETRALGIESGSDKSAVFVNDILYYKTPSGIVRYDGAYPQRVDIPLGNERYKNAIAGSLGSKYYVSMEDYDDIRYLFVYDTETGLWHKEDCGGICDFCRCGSELYFLSKEEDTSLIYSSSPCSYTENEEDVFWRMDTAVQGYLLPDRKYVCALQIRLSGKDRARANIYIEYDSSGLFERAGSLLLTKSEQYIRISPRRCDHFRIRLEGVGECTLISLGKIIQRAGEGA